MLGFKGLNRFRVAHVDVLQGFQAGKLIVVLQNVFYPQILTKEFGKGFFVGFFFNICRVWEALLQLADHRHEAALRFTGNHIGKPFQVFLVALLQYHVLGVFITKQGNGIDRRPL